MKKEKYLIHMKMDCSRNGPDVSDSTRRKSGGHRERWEVLNIERRD